MLATGMKLLGIDVGTGGSRAIVIDERGAVIASHTVEHKAFRSPRTLWAEQDPDDWWRASREAVRAVLSFDSVRGDEIAAIGLSGQMHGSVMLDDKGEVVRPALLWCDGRTQSECDFITQRIGRKRLIELVANPALTGFTLPKMLWVRHHEPDAWRRVQKVVLPKDYVRWQLTGEYATDVADASGTLLLDVARRKWSGEMLEAMQLEAGLLPQVYESPEVCARVSKQGAKETGLREGTPVVAGAGDQAAGAVGLGIVGAGAVSATIGTSGVVFAATDNPAFDGRGRVHTFCHAIPNRWHVMGVTLAAGLSLRWFKETFGASDVTANQQSANEDKTKIDDYELLCAEAQQSPAGSDGVLWTPYLMGERTPHLDSQARAALVGLAANHTRAHIVRAILEGVAFSLKDTFEIFREMRVPVESIKLGGGGARSKLWRQIQADVYGHAVETAAAEEGAAFGAALLAGVGAKAWSSVNEACAATTNNIASRTEPEREAVKILSAQYERYKLLYPSLKAITQ